jgi:hypothetical protein
MRCTFLGQKIPSFRAVLPVATEPQRLPKTPKLVSDRLLSLFTRTPAEKVRSPKVTDFWGFSSKQQPNLSCPISAGEIAETGGTPRHFDFAKPIN